MAWSQSLVIIHAQARRPSDTSARLRSGCLPNWKSPLAPPQSGLQPTNQADALPPELRDSKLAMVSAARPADRPGAIRQPETPHKWIPEIPDRGLCELQLRRR